MPQKRYYGLDALRILAMLFVVTVHSLSHGKVLASVEKFTLNWYLAYFMLYASLAAVNCFVLLSAYFLVASEFRVKRLVSFALHVLFYSLGIFLICWCLGIVKPTLRLALTALLPISSSCYWFPTAYFGMLLLSPFLNSCIKAMSKRQLQMCTLCLIAVFSLVPNIALVNGVWNIRTGHCLQWFVVIYFIAAYIRLYVFDIKGSVRLEALDKIPFLLIYIACPLINLLLRRFVPDFFYGIFGKGLAYDMIHGDNSILVTTAATALFLFFLRLDIKSDMIISFIKKVSPLVFGVYLIHESPFLREYLWSHIFTPKAYANTNTLLPYILFAVCSIFAAGLLSEVVRGYIFGFIEKSRFFTSFCDKLSSNRYLSLMENNFKE